MQVVVVVNLCRLLKNVHVFFSQAFAANGFTPAYAQVYQPSPRPVYPGSHNNRGNRGGKTYVGGGAREREAAYHDRHHHHHSEHNSQPQQQAAKESKSTVLSASDTPSQQQHPQPTQSSTSSSTSHQENNTRRSESTRDPPLHVNRCVLKLVQYFILIQVHYLSYYRCIIVSNCIFIIVFKYVCNCHF